MTDQPGIRFGVANGVLVVALLLAGAARLGDGETGLIAVLVFGLACAGLSTTVCVSMGMVSWAMFTGFVENSYGLLTFAPDDLEHLAALLVGVLALAALARRTSSATKESAHQ